MSIPVLHIYRNQQPAQQPSRTADFRERIMAQFIDGIILGAIVSLLLLIFSKGKLYSVWISPVFPFYLVQSPAGYLPNPADWWWGGYFVTISLPYVADLYLASPSVLQWLIYALYYSTFTAFFGQTPGKMLKGLVVLTENEGRLSLKKSVLRWLLCVVGILPAGAGLWQMFMNEKKKAFHDKTAGTTVYSFLPLED